MITTLMPHLRIGPYKEGVIIDQIQMPFHAVGRSFPYELLVGVIRSGQRKIPHIFCRKQLEVCMYVLYVQLSRNKYVSLQEEIQHLFCVRCLHMSVLPLNATTYTSPSAGR